MKTNRKITTSQTEKQSLGKMLCIAMITMFLFTSTLKATEPVSGTFYSYAWSELSAASNFIPGYNLTMFDNEKLSETTIHSRAVIVKAFTDKSPEGKRNIHINIGQGGADNVISKHISTHIYILHGV